MGDTTLCLLLLLSAYAIMAQQGGENDEPTSATCALASRFKANRKYVYQYVTESRNGVTGTANLRNGPKVTCQVEVEVPVACSFKLQTSDCVLSEVSVMDPQGQPVFRQAAGSEAFQADMAKYPLMFTVEQATNVRIFPEADEPAAIANVKRGIISALLVPVMEEEQNSLMSTVHGLCPTAYTVQARKDIVTDASLTRDLAQCDQFYSRPLPSSPLALVQRLHRPLSQLIRSTQSCSYQFDNRRKHMTNAACTETHLYLPFSHGNNGMSSVVTQTLTLLDSSKINNRQFSVHQSQGRPLHLEDVEDKAPIQTKDATIGALRDLASLAGTDQGERRTGLFHQLVSGMRALKNDTLSPAVAEMMEVSAVLTWQALLQCGTAECTSAILWAVRAAPHAETDALVYGLSLLAGPDAHRVRDVLSMAQFRQSRAVMYALAHTVRKFHEGDVTPEVNEVAEFMQSLLEDCSQNQDTAFLALRVVGVMGRAMQDVSHHLVSSLLRCARNANAPLANQKAAIQALRLMDIDDEARDTLMEVYRDARSPVEKRVAAYLMLMKSPGAGGVKALVDSLENMEDKQLKSFVVSHMIRDTKDKTGVINTLSRADIGYIGTSHSYQAASPLGFAMGNVIFDQADTLPKEVMLEMTLAAFDYAYDILEVGVEGSGFQPTIEALFGENGFFPDAVSKAAYWTGDHVPAALQGVLDRIAPQRRRRQVPEDLLKDLTDGLHRLVDEVRSAPAPEATAYLRLLGQELGYVKSSDVAQAADMLTAYYQTFFKTLPAQALKQLMSSTDNDMFAHYIFMENAFTLPTGSGFPLKFSLAGVFAPGARGGIARADAMHRLSFMPAVGVEFVTQMGVHVPEAVAAGMEMHTNLYHESSLNAKVTVGRNQLQLALPAPRANTQLFSVSNKLLSVSSSQTRLVPSLVEDRTDATDCQHLFTGLNLCTVMRYSAGTDGTPYYPLTGESRFAVEMQPTGQVSEYTATITAETLREGQGGRQKVDVLTLRLKAEGVEGAEAMASLKYNRNRNTVTTEVQIPDFDVEAGFVLAVTDASVKGKNMRGITIDVTNKHVPQLSLVVRTRLEMMKDAVLQVQLLIPSLSADASLSASLKRDPALILAIESILTLPKTRSLQKLTLKYDNDRLEAELNSDLNSELQELLPNAEAYHRKLQQLLDDLLDQRVARTDMKLRHIVTKAIEAANIWLDKLAARIPYAANLRLRRSIADLTLPALPQKLFMQSDSFFRYQFNKNKMAISLPLPLGGRTSEELNIPRTLSVPLISWPAIGLHIPANDYPVPSFTVPRSLDFAAPLLGLAEASAKVNSNFYNWEASLSGGNDTVTAPSYILHYKVSAQSPINPLSYKLEGTGMMSGNVEDNLKYLVDGSFSHSLVDARFSLLETLSIADQLNAMANYKIEATSPLGLHAFIFYAAKSTSTSEEVTGDGTLEGSVGMGSQYANASYSHNYAINPLAREGRGESNLRVTSPLIQAHNMIQGAYANSELSIVSITNAQNDALKHVAELKYKDAQLTLKSNSAAAALGTALSNKVEIGLSRHMAIVRVESQADDAANRAYSLITGSLDSNGLNVNSEGSLAFDAGRGLHKASVVIGGQGLVVSGTNTIQCSPLTFENIFNGVVDGNGASLSCHSKALAEESKGELNIDGKFTAAEASWNAILKGYSHDVSTRNSMSLAWDHKALTLSSDMMGSVKQMKAENSHMLTLTLWTLALDSKMDNFICDDAYYKHDIKVGLKPFVASLDVKNALKFYDANLNNEGHLALEPLKMNLAGSVRGTYGQQQELRHTYELIYADLAGAMKFSTAGHIMDAQLSHNCELEFAGLSAKSLCEARINSKPLRFDSTVRTMALPFSFSVDALVNSDGEMNLYGKHTGQFYSKLLVKVQPLALAYSHDSRASTTHMIDNEETATHIDNKWDGLLTPGEQSLILKTKSSLNGHAYNQDIYAYNNPERVGVDFNGGIITDILSKAGQRRRREDQEFSVAGFLKYDKNSQCHMVELPFVESFPVAFELIKDSLVNALESLQQFINRLDLNEAIRRFRDRLDHLPMQVSDFMRELDMDNKVSVIKEKLAYLMKEFAVTIDDLEIAVENLKEAFERLAIDFAYDIKNIIAKVKDFVKSGNLSDAISNVLSAIGNQAKAFDEKYEIRQSLVRAIDATEGVMKQIDLQKLTESSVEWLKELDAKYDILKKIQEEIAALKRMIETFDVKMFFQDIKDYILSIDMGKYVEQLSTQVPTAEMVRVIDSMKDVIVNWIEEYEIPNKFNAVFFYIRDLLLKYDLDKRFEMLMDNVVVLIKEFKIQETVQSLVDALAHIDFEFVYNKMMQLLDTVTSHLKRMDFKQSIDELNERIASTLKYMEDFDYGAFVDEANQKIVELTDYINEQMKAYDIVSKLEAIREFFREMQTSVFKYIEKLRDTKVAEVVRRLMDVINTAAVHDIKLKIQEMLEDMRQRVVNTDIRHELYKYLQRASESYGNMVAYVSVQINRLIEEIRRVTKDHVIINQINQAVDGVLEALKTAELEVPSFTVPLTDLVLPAFKINLNKLQEIAIPARIAVPTFVVLNYYVIPAFTIDFEAMKANIISVIDRIREYEIKIPEPEEIFGDLRALYLSDLPDLTFAEITLSEIRFPAINLPKLNLEDFEITMLPIPEFKMPEIPREVCVPVFGKLYGEFRVNSPHYTLVSMGAIENSTTTAKNPQFTATLTSQGRSSFEFLDYSLDATAKLEAPRMKKLLFTESVKLTHEALSIDHEGSMTITGPSAEAAAKTTAKATTQMYAADLVNSLALTLQGGISATMDTTYNHNVNIPTAETSSQATMAQNVAAKMEVGMISLTARTTGSGKWSIQDYSDEGTHKSDLDFTVDFSTAKLTFGGETDCKALKMKQTVAAESVVLSHITFNARAETELPFVRSSIMVLNGEAQLGELRVALRGSHNAELTGRLSGSVSNSLEFLARPFEIVLDAKNKANAKIIFPLTLTGKLDLQQDYGVILNPEQQRACWVALARFNQYKYSHDLTAENSENDVIVHASANGEANLEFLTVPLTIPAMAIPYTDKMTPEVRDFSLWDDAGLGYLMSSPQQSFDMNFKLHYQKSPNKHTFELDLEPIYSAINDNANILQEKFEECRDKVVALLKDSYNQAKIQFDKHKIDTSSQPPRFFRVPGYKIPVFDIEVSAFRAELPAFSYFVPKEVSTPSFKVPAMGFSVPSYTLVLPSLQLPVIHVPETLSELTLPHFTLPAIRNSITIPAMGNIICDFSFKCNVITLAANAGLYNDADTVARFAASSASVFDVLNGKIDATTSLATKTGIKVGTTVSLEHKNMAGSHDCTVSLSRSGIEASLANTGKINLPFLNLEFDQELIGNTQTKPNIGSKMKLKYMFNIPLIEAVGTGNLDQNLGLEALTSHVSLETTTKGKTDITIMDIYNAVGDLDNEASFYLNANGLRSLVKTDLNVNMDRKQGTRKRRADANVLKFVMNENLALEVSLRRVYGTLDFTSSNNANVASFNTNGNHAVKVTIEFVPLMTLKATVEVDAAQPSSLGDAGLVLNIDLAVTSEKQTFAWSDKKRLGTLIQDCNVLLSNDAAEIRVVLRGNLEGHLAFLKSFRLPVYQRTIWDVLKFDQVTNMDNLQIFTLSSIVVYTKSTDGYNLVIPFTFLEDGVSFHIPAITLALPAWVKEIPSAIRKIDMRLESIDVPDHITLPPVISVPAFDVPFTTLHVGPFTLDPNNLNIPKVMTTTAFEIMLPGWPTIAVPSYIIDTEYLQGKMSFLSFKMPQYEIAISSFTLPKSFTVGEYTVDLDDIVSRISNLEIPTIVIPEQTMEIPAIALHLPSSVIVPAFGALAATVEVSSPIYSVKSTAKVEKKDSSLVSSLNSICTSTMIFLEYDLDAVATLGFDNGAVSLNGICKFIHSDVTIDWQHVFQQNLRMRRQAAATDVVSRHTLNVDVTSQTFADVSFRFASRRDGMTASVSSPSAGFLGLYLQRRSPTQLYGKLFSRYLSTPEKDTDILTVKSTLRNAEKLSLQTAWNLDVLHDITEGAKERLPAVTDAVLKCVNKYHVAHFGFDLNRAGMKLKNSVSNGIERLYHEVPASFTAVQGSLEQLGERAGEMYGDAADSALARRVRDAGDRIARDSRDLLKRVERNISALLQAVMSYLSDTTFTLPPGLGDEKLTGREIYRRVHGSVSAAADRAVRWWAGVAEAVRDAAAGFVRGVEFAVPGTGIVVSGNGILENLASALRAAEERLLEAVGALESMSLEMLFKKLGELLQWCVEKAEVRIASLRAHNAELAAQIDGVYADAQNTLRSTRDQLDEAKRSVAEYKDRAKMMVQEIYNAATMDRVNNDLMDVIGSAQYHLFRVLTDGIEFMKMVSQSTAPYVRVSSKKADVDVPLPFFWKSFSEWPTQFRP